MIAALLALGIGGSAWPAVPGFRKMAAGPEHPVPLRGRIVLYPPAIKAKAVEIIVRTDGPGRLLTMGTLGIDATKDGWRLANAPKLRPGPWKAGDLLDVALVSEGSKCRLYMNGRAVTTLSSPLLSQITLSGDGGALVGAVGYPRALSSAEVAKNAAEAAKLAVLKDTVDLRIEGELVGMTPVPDPNRIKPYRTALLAHEYRIVSIDAGRLNGLKPGSIVRVFRFGVVDGQQTDLKSLKIGDHVHMTIMPAEADPQTFKIYQLDALETETPTQVYLERTKTTK